MVVVRIRRPTIDGREEELRVTAATIERAVKVTGGRVVFPIDGDEFRKGGASRYGHMVETMNRGDND